MSDQNEGQTESRIVQMAAFSVGTEEYVVDIMRIKEIINPLKITPVPSAAALIEGVINLRGVIIPIVDMRKRFMVPEESWNGNPKYIIVVVAGKIVGIVVDEVLEVVRIPRSIIKPSPQLFVDKEPGMFLGVCEFQGRLLLLVDLKKVLSPALADKTEAEISPEPARPEIKSSSTE
ncbi:MAG: chemotaxis protein CheW [Deltaproteobacteria bacterium]|nr:chemotaxis protein CheW [Deltaproteobacteria bacterium]